VLERSCATQDRRHSNGAIYLQCTAWWLRIDAFPPSRPVDTIKQWVEERFYLKERVTCQLIWQRNESVVEQPRCNVVHKSSGILSNG
jgi:hypothetical protein